MGLSQAHQHLHFWGGRLHDLGVFSFQRLRSDLSAFWSRKRVPYNPQYKKSTLMKNWILNFINDERGAESVELGITGAVVAGGAVAGFSLVKGKVIEKQEELVDKLDESTAG